MQSPSHGSEVPPSRSARTWFLIRGMPATIPDEVRERPQVAVSIVSTKNPWHWLSISGRVVDIQPDEDLAFIDRMSLKYTGKTYERRTPREVFTVAVDRVSSSGRWGRR